ncbi:MAG: hypothetical protein ACTHNL_11225 [Devosia sp.]|jgi:hypothetical protein
MTLFQFFAVVGMPAILFLVGLVALKWTQWDLRRRDRMHPGE